MKKSKIFLATALLAIATSCATQYVASKSNLYEKYQNDQVSVQTALMLAQNSYLLACVKAKKEEHKNKHHFANCQKLAKNYIQNTVKFILKQ